MAFNKTFFRAVTIGIYYILCTFCSSIMQRPIKTNISLTQLGRKKERKRERQKEGAGDREKRERENRKRKER